MKRAALGDAGLPIGSCFIEDAPNPRPSRELGHLTLKQGIDVDIGGSDFLFAPGILGGYVLKKGNSIMS